MNPTLTWEKNWPDLRALLRGGFPRFVAERHPTHLSGGIPVFCYHAADPAIVEADLTFLTENGYHTLTATELLTQLAGGEPPPEHSVVLTVDDGAHDLYSVLFPALQRHRFHAIAFIATAFHRESYHLPDHARPCTWDELREMDASGCVDVQGHTHSHRYLPHWPRPLDLVGIDPAYSRAIQAEETLSPRDDLARAHDLFQTHLNKPITHLAFPMYTGTTQTIAEASDLGVRGFWWGTLPHRPVNRPGDPATHIVRLSAEFIRRLPGRHRASLTEIIKHRLNKPHPPSPSPS